MIDVVIAGIGQTTVGEHWEISLRSLANEAVQLAMLDAGGIKPQVLYVGNSLAPFLSRQTLLGSLLADFSGLSGIEAASIEAGGASGGAALRQGFLAIKSGMVDVALVVGVEKFTDAVGSEVESALASGLDSEYESPQGLTSSGQAALLAQRYFHEFHLPIDGLASFPMVSHANGAGNKYAMFRKPITLETYKKSEIICPPLNLFDIAPNADGAAAVLLARRDFLPPEYIHPPVRIASSSSVSDTLALHDRPDILELKAARRSVEICLNNAGIILERINLFEYFDSSSIIAALSLEAAGFAKPGEGWNFGKNGEISLTGKIPCATMGGLKARGNPMGATGVYQAVEAALQLRELAGVNQIKHPKYALIQSLGGPASIAVSHIFERLV